MPIYIFLILSFLQIGFLGIGSSPSAQALIEHEVVTLHHWLTPEQMANLMVFCRILPGGTGLNTASLTGAMTAAAQFGFWGSVLASVLSVTSLIIPAALWTSVIARFEKNRQCHDFLNCSMVVLRPLIPGLVAAAAILLMRADNFGSFTKSPWDFWMSTFLFLSTLIGVGYYRFNSLFIVLLCGLAGLMIY